MVDHSFVVMAYKDSPYLSSCLESLLLQKSRSQVLIATSTPSTYITKMAQSYGIEIVVNETGKSIADDWNFGLSQARTKYVTLAHQDDVYLPAYTSDCLQAADKFSDSLICFTDYRELDIDKAAGRNVMLAVKELILWVFMPLKKDLRTRLMKRLLLTFGSPIACPSVMYNLERLKDFSFSVEYSISLDWEAWLRLSDVPGRFVYVPKVLMKHRIHTDSETTAGLESKLRQSEDLKMFKKIWPPVIAGLFVKLYSGSYLSNRRKTKPKL
jgi:glycosyltransferase involved in cell wall biosynthesis